MTIGSMTHIGGITNVKNLHLYINKISIMNINRHILPSQICW